MIVDPRTTQSKIDRYIVFHLPNSPDERGASPRLTEIPIVENLGDRPHRPIARPFGNDADKKIGMLLTGQRRSGIEVEGQPFPLLGEDAGQRSACAPIGTNPRQQNTELRRDARTGLFLQYSLSQDSLQGRAVLCQTGAATIS